jgi:hypothetical protein
MIKKIFALVLALVFVTISFSQGYPLQQNLGSDSTIVISKGALQSRLIPIVITDTNSANAQRLKNYPGAQLYTTNGDFYIRNSTATKWVLLSSGSSGSVNIYTADGTLTGNRTLTGANNNLTFDGLNKFTVTTGDTTLFNTNTFGIKGVGGVLNVEGTAAGTTSSLTLKTASDGNWTISTGVAGLELGDLRFYDNDNGGGSARMIIKSTGKVGIGTETPDSMLSVAQGAYFGRGIIAPNLPSALGTKALRIDAQGKISVADTTLGGGTVIQVNTNDGSGITGGPITVSGTLAIDTTNVIATKLSVAGGLAGKLNISDTANMLKNYVNQVGYALTKVNQVVSADSATLSNYYLRRKDSLTATNSLGYVTKTVLADTAAAIRSADAGGTVTSVATNNGTGITGGTITTSGTLAIDTLLISTRAWRQKGVDSLQANINLKLNISDTASMLSPYLRKADTTAMLANYVNNVGYALSKVGQVVSVDSSTLSNYYLRRKDSLTATNLLGYVTRTILADTAAAIRGADAGGTVTSVATNNGTGITGGTITTSGTLAIDTTVISTRAWRQKGVDSLQANIDLKLNISDTSSMLSPYLRNVGYGLDKISAAQLVLVDTLEISTRAWRQKGIDSVAALINSNVSGTTNYVPKFTGTNTLGNSVIYDNGGEVLINTISDSGDYKLQVNGNAYFTNSTANATGAIVPTAGTGLQLISDGSSSADRSFIFKMGSTERMRLNDGGNLGLGVAPSSWLSFFRALQIGNTNSSAFLYGRTDASLETGWGVNAYYSSTSPTDWVYTNSGPASYLAQISGGYRFYTAASGTAGNAISWTQAMTLSPVGNLGIGDSNPDSMLTVYSGTHLQRGVRLSGLPSGIGTKELRIDANGVVYANDTLANDISGSGTTNYIPKFTGTSAIGNSNLQTDNSGNLGLGVTPSAWGSIFQAAQIGTGGSIFGRTSGNQDVFQMGANVFYDGANWKYIANGFSTRYEQASGIHAWHTAPSGTAGNTISFTQAMTLNASGNLGLGVTPSAWGGNFRAFEMQNGSYFATFNSRGLYIGENNFYNGINFIYKGSFAASNYYQVDGQHVWQTAPSGTAGNTISFTQAMTLDASGNLGIGTTSPASRLNVDGSAGTMITTNSSNGSGYTSLSINSAGSNKALIGFGTYLVTGGGLGFRTASSVPISFSIGGATEAMFINASSNVGIGTTNPNLSTSGTALTVNAAASSNAAIEISDGGTLAGLIYGRSGTGVNLWSIPAIPLIFGSNNAERMRITSGGNLLLGTTTDKTTVIGASGTGQTIGGSGTVNLSVWNTGNADWVYSLAVGNDGTVYNYNKGNTPMTFWTNASERMRITSGGNVGIGTTTPQGKLDITGGTGDLLYLDASINTDFAFKIVSGADDALVLRRQHSTQGDLSVMSWTYSGKVGIGTISPNRLLNLYSTSDVFMQVDRGSITSLFGTDNEGTYVGQQGAYILRFITNSAERMRITSGGNVGINQSSPSSYTGFTTLHINGQSGANGGLLRLTAFDNSSSVNIYAGGSAINFNTTSAVPFVFLTQDTERMRITSGGNVLVGTTTDNGNKFQVSGTANATQFNSTSGTVSVAPSTNTTFFTPSGAGLYMAHVYLDGNATQTWDATIIFAYNATNILVVNQTNGVNVSTQISGTDIQVRQIGGTTYTFNYEVIRIK